MKVDIFLNKTVEENAAYYFEKAKKMKKKLKGAISTIEKFERIQKEEQAVESKAVAEPLKKRRKLLWFEKFRWFYSSTGFLVIGGRDSTTNEMMIKKYSEKNDLIFHTDMAGSPFFVVKSNSREIDKATLSEVADATCSFSRAWKLGLTTSSVFYVSPEQVTKEAKAGEYLGKGSFVIKGKTNYIDNRINLAIGKVKDGEASGLIMCAPVESIKVHCDKFFSIKQGDTKPSDIAKKLKRELDAEIDEIIRILPPGNIDIIKERAK